MPRPWACDGDRDVDGGDPPSEDVGDGDAGAGGTGDAEEAPFPTLDLPWPDGDVAGQPWLGEDEPEGEPGVDDVPPFSGPGPGPGPGEDPGLSWSEPAPCRGPRRQVRPVNRRRSRHSFEPLDLCDADLDRPLRGSSPGPTRAPTRASTDGVPPASARSWPAWAKLALASGVLLVVVGIVGVLTAAGDTADTITTRGQGRRPPTTASPTTAGQPASAAVDPPASPPISSPPPTAALPRPTGTVQTPPPARSSGATALPDRAAEAATAARPCHPSYEPCVPVAEDVDCAGGQGNGPAYLDHTVHVTGPDVYALDADNDDQACE